MRARIGDLRRQLLKTAVERGVPLESLLSPAFMSAHSQFASFAEMVASRPAGTTAPADVASVPMAEWNTYVAGVTPFPTWEALLAAAAVAWAADLLDLDSPEPR